MTYWVVIVETEQLAPHNDGLLATRRANRQRAEAYGTALACFPSTNRVEVFSPGGVLEYLYEKDTGIWQCISDDAKQIHADMMKTFGA